MNADVDEKHLKTSMQNFYRYFNAHDERRNTNFIKTCSKHIIIEKL